MKIGIDVRPLSRPGAGIARAVRNILEQLQGIDTENTYYLYSDREFGLPLQNSLWHKRISRHISFLPGSAWLQTAAKSMAVGDRVDVFWGTAHALPLGLPSSVRKVLTVNDLVWPDYSKTMSFYNRLVNRLLLKRSARQANVVLVPSQSTQRGLRTLPGVTDLRIRMVPYGVEGRFQPSDRLAAAERIAEKYGTSQDYLCSVGTVEPRKNLTTLIEAIRTLRDRHQCAAQLLVAGPRGWKNSRLHTQLVKSGLTRKNVKFLGYIPEEDMAHLYAVASVFVFPSLYEGFGFPVLEAMACGVPVVASNVSSIPEVADGAAVLVDPHKPSEFAEAISRVRSSPSLRDRLVRTGITRAAQFKWEASARAVVAVLTGEFETISQLPDEIQRR